MTTLAAARARRADAPEAEIIEAVVAGDRARFAELVRRHNQALYRACRAVLGADADAEDAVQAAWVAVFRALPGYRGEAAFRTWATRIAVNEASARLRRRGRLAEVSLEEVSMKSDGDGDPERAVHEGELGRFLERHIDALPEGMRTVLVLRDVLELDTAETAACLGIAEEAVRVRLHRARRAMAESTTAALGELLDGAGSRVWRFDGERCARVLARVMDEIAV